MRVVAIALVCVGCANDPVLGPATWTETPAGDGALFKQSYVTRSGEIAVRFYDDDSSPTCSEIKVATFPADGEARISFSAPAIDHPSSVSVTNPLDPATASAAVIFASRTYTAGTLTLTQTGDRLVGTFMAAGTTSDGTAATIEGSFDAPFCD
jgi:hypothetical protein